MLKELFDRMTEQAQQAADPKTLKPKAEPDHVYYIVDQFKNAVRHDATPTPRAHRAFDLETIARWACDPMTPVEIWCSRIGIVLLLDDNTRRDRVSLALESSPQLDSLMFQATEELWFDQKRFISLLRIDFAGCHLSSSLLQSVRQVRFSVLKGLEGEVSHGKESIGKTLAAELKGANAVPEEIVLNVPIWTGNVHPTRYQIACAVEIDPIGEKFQLIPFPGAIEDAICRAETDLMARLGQALTDAGAQIDVSYGTP